MTAAWALIILLMGTSTSVGTVYFANHDMCLAAKDKVEHLDVKEGTKVSSDCVMMGPGSRIDIWQDDPTENKRTMVK